MTLRADFYGRALRHRPLADALQGHVENLGPMNREELQAAILRPAENADVSFEPGLVETLLDDVESKPGSLPLLQFALREMWGRQETAKITHQSYDAIGGVEGALAQRAEAIFAAMTANGANPQMEQAFQRLFTRLVTLGEGRRAGGYPTHRRAP
jgi:conflict system STAND superfamily ATPase